MERTIRDARESLPEPEQEASERARTAVLAATPKGQPRRMGRLALVAAVLVAALAGAFAAGLALAPSGSTKVARADGPGFLPAQGWDTFQTGATTPPQAPTATAANVKLGPDVLVESIPWQTVAKLRSGQVLLEALFSARGESAAIDAQYRPRSLPLSLADAKAEGPFEGQPPNATAERLLARVNGWNVELFVFYGGKPTRAARAAAQEELGRLVVPEAAPGVLETRPALRPSPNACRASALRSRVLWQGATGSLMGAIRVTNVGGRACALYGVPTVEMVDANGVRMNVRQEPAKPLWKQLGAPRPNGWPIVRMPGHGSAQVFVRLRNWCVTGVKPLALLTYLPGVGEHLPAQVEINLRCDVPGQPPTLSVGPVEPVR
ncbi:MAG TPA: DUF4232 domain-containing protein [Gaiellaceae bacterium]|nr:DUF4232 domain-containing protein [Gaiellaceae bacterium]